MTEATDAQLMAMLQLVADALEVQEAESLQQAAFRTVRHNVAPRVVQHCARLILGVTSKGPRDQWHAIHECHKLLTTAPKPRDTNGQGKDRD